MIVAGMRLSLRSYGECVASHTHDFNQLVFPVVGAIRTRIGDMDGEISAHCMAVIPRGMPHSSRASGPNRFLVLDTESPSAAREPAFRALDPRLSNLVRYAAAELTAGELPVDTEIHMAALLVSRIRQDVPERSESHVARALSVMAAQYDCDLSIRALAKAAGLGVSRFHDAFRRETGQTPAGMLRDIRLAKAATLLRETDHSIADIALMVGFSDQTALTRCFRRFRATTPNAVRREAAVSAG
jgi:AraC-like DNA-binding protein